MPRSSAGRRFVPRLIAEFFAFAALIGTLLVLSPLGSVWVQLSVTSAGSGTSTLHYAAPTGAALASRPISTGDDTLRFVYPPATIAHETRQLWTPCDCGASATVRAAGIHSILISAPATATDAGSSFAISGSPRKVFLENLGLLAAIAVVLSAGAVALLERVRRRSRRPRTLAVCALYVSSAIVFIAGVVLLRFGNWDSISRSADPVGVVTSTLPAFAIAGFLLLVGLAALSLVPRYRWGLGSIGLSIGAGMALISVIVALTHTLLGNATVAILPVGIVAAVILIVKIALRLRTAGGGLRYGLFQLWTRVVFAAGFRTSIVLAVLSIAIIAPMARDGLTAWTHGTNDFHSYVGSTQVWLSSPSDFAAKHPDNFGAQQLDRASFEKPLTTAFMVVAAQLTGLAPYKLLTPITVLLVFVLLAGGAYVARRAFRLAEPLTWLAVGIPALSIVPFSRVIDAQPGQAVAAALLATFLALWVSLSYRSSKWMPIWGLVLSGIVLCAALGSNFTLVAGALPALLLAVFWLASREGYRFRDSLRNLVAVGIVAIILSAPFIRMLFNSFIGQTNGDPGFDVPLASPLALIGQQFSLRPLFGQTTNEILWVILIIAAAVALLVAARRSVSARWLAAFVAVVVVTFVVVAVKLGVTNYAAHKYTAIAIAVFLPLGFALLFTIRRSRIRKVVVPVVALATVSALVLAVLAGTTVVNRGTEVSVLPRNLVALESNARLAKVSELNIEVTGYSPGLMAPLIVPSKRVTAVEPLVGFTSPPVGNLFLIDSGAVAGYPWKAITPLNSQYSTAKIDVALGAGSTSFAASNGPAERFLFGSWFPAEAAGTWATGNGSYLVFDPADALAGKNVTVTVTGVVHALGAAGRTLTMTANGAVVGTQHVTSDSPATLTFTVPSAAIAANGGRVALSFATDNALTLSSQRNLPSRQVGFQLQTLAVAAG